MHWPRLTRDAAMFVIGAIGFLHEVFIVGPTERPFLLAACAALMGLPFIFQGPTESSRSSGRWRREPRWPTDEELGVEPPPWERRPRRVERSEPSDEEDSSP